MKPYYQKMKGGSTMKVPGMYQGGGGKGTGRVRNWFNKTFSKGVHLPGTGKAKVKKRSFKCTKGKCR